MTASRPAGAVEQEDVNAAHQSLSPVVRPLTDVTWMRGEGHYLYDSDGRRYLDMLCGFGVTSLGHRHPAVQAAIEQQLSQLVHVSTGVGVTGVQRKLAGLLCGTLPVELDTVFFVNSGTEAIEAALKLARCVTGRLGVVAFTGGFHGRTMGSLSVTTSSARYRSGLEPLMSSVHFAPFIDGGVEGTSRFTASLDALNTHISDFNSIGAVIVEPVQGEGGVHVAAPAFLKQVREFCDRHDILLIVDEVQSGFGRTGQMWAFEHAGIVPDIVCMAKAMANGLPLGAIVSKRDLQERWGPGAHGSTFGGNPVACAAGIAVLETIEQQGILENVRQRGDALLDGLQRLCRSFGWLRDARGIGLMIAMRVGSPVEKGGTAVDAEGFARRCLDRGLLIGLCGPHHDSIRMLPPIDIQEEEIVEALAIVESVALEVAPRE